MTQRTDWLEDFHAGKREVLQECYETHFSAVDRAVGQVLSGYDRETVIQEVFLSLLERPELRERFHGGSMRGWLCTMARRRAIDYGRKWRREVSLDELDESTSSTESVEEGPNPEERMARAECDAIVRRFRDEVLRAEWAPLFEARFVRQESQRDAARALGMSRTTLAYREMCIRRQLRSFVLEEGLR